MRNKADNQLAQTTRPTTETTKNTGRRPIRGTQNPLASSALLAALAILGTSLLAIPATSSRAETHPRRQPPQAENSTEQWRAELARWRQAHADHISAPDGWLSLVALDWLKPGTNTVGHANDNSIPLLGNAPEHLAVIDVEASSLVLQAPAGGFPPALRINGKPVTPGVIYADDATPPDTSSTLTDQNLELLALHRGDRYALRIKDATSPARLAFRGLNWYPPNPAFRITARWIPFPPGHTAQIPTVIGTTLKLPAPGLAEFTLKGKTIQLEPVLEEPGATQLFFILRDATSHSTTYQASRFLYTNLPDHGLDQPGSVVLDFNRLENPPCAYTPYATCPLPPFENRLPIALEAGEKRYRP
uniref:DUF1684 domain-containing protein n=1 Tax=mine drainage metagenome TaxID=410659 RepID=E6QIP6_9ZZZZ